MKKHIFGIAERSLAFALIFSILVSFTKFSASCENLRSNILRIHILANSDSTADQEVKLKVRDAVIAYTGGLFDGCDSLSSAKEAAGRNLKGIKKVCEKTLKDCGFDYSCSVKLGKAFFKTREYDGFTLPAGCYDSVTVTLGNGGGHNWWCVIYPSVCIGGSKQKLKKIGDGSEISLEPNRYKIRFKITEVYESLKSLTRRGK